MRRLAGLYLITARVRPVARLEGIVSAAIDGGVALVQFREKEAAEDRTDAARIVAGACRRRNIPFLVNDDVDLARALKADGVHVGRGDPSVKRAREAVGTTGIVGVTVYGDPEEENAAHEAGADYIAIGTFYPSPTKPEEPVRPLGVLDGVVRRSPLPVFAIGGINAERARILAGHGVAGVAVISAIMGAQDPGRAAREIRTAFEEGRSSPR